MPAGAFETYDKWPNLVHAGSIVVPTATFKLALFTSASNAATLSNDEFADLTSQVSGGGYPAGGVTLTSVAVAIDDTRNSKMTAADVVPLFTATAAVPFRYAVVYVSGSGGGLTNPLVSVSTWLDANGDPVDFTVPNTDDFNFVFSTAAKPWIVRFKGTPVSV